MRYQTLLIYLLAILLSGCSTQGDSIIDGYLGFDIQKDALDRYIEQKMRELKIPGLSIALINKGEISYNHTYG